MPKKTIDTIHYPINLPLTISSLVVSAFLSCSAIAQIEPNNSVNVSNPAAEADSERDPDLATDEVGTWITVWVSDDDSNPADAGDEDIFSATSTNNGATWSAPVKVNVDDASPTRVDREPQIATDGAGNWVTVWASNEDVLGNGTDFDVLSASSSNNGASWSSTRLLTRPGAPFVADGDAGLALETDRAGNWLAIYASKDNADLSLDSDRDILASRSTDNGATWTGPVPVNLDAATDSISANDDGTDGLSNVRLALVSDRDGLWIAAWTSTHNFGGNIGTDRDILYARSTDNGASWKDHGVLNNYADVDNRTEANMSLATDYAGNWIAVWNTNFDNGVSRVDDDIFYARSADDGLNWTASELLNSNGIGDIRNDESPVVRTDAEGNWVVIWDSDDNIGGNVGDDLDMFVSFSRDFGETWSDAKLLNLNGAAPADNDEDGALATDTNGNWVAVWESEENPGIDRDIFSTRFTLATGVNNSLTGRVVTGSGIPVSCAVVEATLVGEITPRIAVTDLIGAYRFASLFPGVYDLVIFSPDFGRVEAGTVDLSAGSVTDFEIALLAPVSGTLLSGQILDTESTEPLVGVSVVASENDVEIAQTYTCATGEFVLVLPGNRKGSETVDLELTQPNYAAKAIDDVNVPSTGTELDQTLTKTVTFPATLVGTTVQVMKGPGDPLAGARITITGPANITATTNGQGVYAFDSVLSGFYTVVASAQGYARQSANRNIVDGEAAVQSFQLDFTGTPSDVNGDGNTNALDVQFVINGALGLPTGSSNTDVNGDGQSNAIDVQLVINAVLGL